MTIWQYAEITNTPCSYAEYADKYAKYVKQYAKHDAKKICNLHIFLRLDLCRSGYTEYQIEMKKSSGSRHALQGGMYQCRAEQLEQMVLYYSMWCTNAALCHTKYAQSLYSEVDRVAGL